MQTHTRAPLIIDSVRAPLPLLALFLGVCLALLPAAGNAEQSPRERVIEVQGQASVSAVPDQALLRLSVSQRGMEVGALRRAVTERSNKVLAHLRNQGIEDRQISAAGITLRPEYRWDQQQRQQELVGYLVERQITASLQDLDKLSAVVEGAADAGADQIAPPELGRSDATALRRAAVAQAAQDARANAEAIAAALGLSLGEPVAINALPGALPRPLMENRMLRAAAADSVSGPAEYLSGEISFDAMVQASFYIND